MHGEGGECLINGLFIGSGRQHLDNYMLVEHASPHCASRQFYNGILDEHAHGVFHGRIIVHKDAQKTDAKQTNRNLLLSDDAQIDTKPQLEIYADDVKCTHGATIGQIEENALFYLRSRGIDEMEARRLLLEAFAGECIERMKPGRGPRLHRVDRVRAPVERSQRWLVSEGRRRRADANGTGRKSDECPGCSRRVCRIPPSPRGSMSREIRADFPILGERVHGRPLVYLDNAATSQKPNAVIEAIVELLPHDNANIHRGVHLLSQRGHRGLRSDARKPCRDLFMRADASEIIFVRGTTEAINLVAQTYGRTPRRARR